MIWDIVTMKQFTYELVYFYVLHMFCMIKNCVKKSYMNYYYTQIFTLDKTKSKSCTYIRNYVQGDCWTLKTWKTLKALK